jgi:aldose 1-epimerase
MHAAVKSEPWGRMPNGQQVELYTLRNSKGMEVAITTYGARLVTIKVPDRTGKIDDVILGFDKLDSYLKVPPDPYFGATVGRYGNRIAGGKFSLDGVTYNLAKNNGANSLHGGLAGFDKKLWTATPHNNDGVLMTSFSTNGEEGYPGNLAVSVIFTVTENNELRIQYSGTTDKDTVINLTNHAYFNLAGQGEGDILGHIATIHADRFTPVDASLIPTGELKPVDGTPFDFRKPTRIGERIDAKDEQIDRGNGYDHNYVLNKNGSGVQLAARVVEPKTGRVLEVLTTEPGVQFYTANSLGGTPQGPGGKAYGKRSAFCLETQHFPDSPNHPAFPSTTLKVGEIYRSETVYRFSVEK